MSVTIQRQDRTADAEIITVSSNVTNAVYRVFRDGVLVKRTRSNRIVVPLPAGGSVLTEIRDDALPAGSSAESFVALQWSRITATEFYRVERFDDPDWVKLADVFDTGATEYRWESPQVGIGVATQFRITPYGTNGNAGTAVTPSVTIAGVPAPPEVTYSFSNSTKKVTVAAA